ncbi:MAG: hypothetical protein IIB25_02540 [Chloroflexi bacterium]|nr:hypothetical protein [Chloroflexota bacterium]
MAIQTGSRNVPFGRQAARALLLLVLISISIVGLSAPASAEHGAGGGATYSSLDAGFSQDLVGTSNHFAGDLAWASDNDLFLSDCPASGSDLHRYDMQSTDTPIFGTVLHPETVAGSNAGCGMINHPNGKIYSNTTLGVVEINATTGAATGMVFGDPGDALGIAVDPVNGDIIYVGSSASSFPILRAPIGGASSVFVLPAVHLSGFVGEIVFDGSGMLYLALRSGGFRIVVVNPDGTWNRSISIPSEPGSIAFHSSANFMLAMNTNGTITKIDTGAGDASSVFASGGARHHLSTVGLDGCLYNTQYRTTTYDDGTETGESSVVRICEISGDGFVPQTPPAGDPAVELDVHPTSCPNPVSARSRGVIPVAILGTGSFDVNDIDVSTLTISAVSPLRSSIEDVATPWGGSSSDPISRNDCGTDGPDGHNDLTLKFDTQELIAAIGPVAKGDVVVVTIEGELIGGGAFSGSDVIWIK